MKKESEKILIAEFIGMQQTDLGWFDNEEVLHLSDNTFDLLFDKSWDWLMPVCFKISEYIKDIYLIEERSDDVEDILGIFNNGLIYTQDDLKVSTNMDDVYDDVIAFIEWYNQKTIA